MSLYGPIAPVEARFPGSAGTTRPLLQANAIVLLACIGAAVATGFLYTASTFGDWQAIQAWRSQWLVAAGVAFICGILLNNCKSNQS